MYIYVLLIAVYTDTMYGADVEVDFMFVFMLTMMLIWHGECVLVYINSVDHMCVNIDDVLYVC